MVIDGGATSKMMVFLIFQISQAAMMKISMKNEEEKSSFGFRQPPMNIKLIHPRNMKLTPTGDGKRALKEEMIPIFHSMGLA
jgi:hypothetical protein